MQQTTLLQPAASGVDHASPKSEKTVITITTAYLKVGDVLTMSHGGVFTVVDSSMDPTWVPFNTITYTTNRMYVDQKDQAMYRQLRKEGMNTRQAIETMRLIGIEPCQAATSNWWGEEHKAPKKELPHYHHRRRF